MALTDEETDTINRLELRHTAELQELEELDRYYEGTQPLSYMHPEILREVDDRIRPVIIFWPQMVVDSVEERLRLEFFKTGDRERDKELWRVWLANEMQLGFRTATVDSMVMRRSYLCVGTNEDDKETPIVTPESPLEVYADVDPRTRRVRAALRRVSDVDTLGGIGNRYATLYLPNETIPLHWSGGWREDDKGRDKHGLGVVPVVPVVNRPRTRGTTKTPRNATVERMGRSDLDAVIPLSDAGCKMATDMMVAGEFVAIPLRGLFGVGPDDLVDSDGKKLTPLQAVLGRLFTIAEGGPDAKAFEFAAAQLANFTGALRELAQLVASISGLPPHYLGMSSDNPASAEAIAGAEARLATRAERKQDSLGVAAVRTARLIDRFVTGEWDPDLASMTLDWRNVRTPTVGAMADAVVKLASTTPAILPLRQARQRLGYDEVEIEEMGAEDEQAAERAPIAAIARGLSDTRLTPDNDGADNNGA